MRCSGDSRLRGNDERGAGVTWVGRGGMTWVVVGVTWTGEIPAFAGMTGAGGGNDVDGLFVLGVVCANRVNGTESTLFFAVLAPGGYNLL